MQEITYKFRFNGRRVGAIGIFGQHYETVTMGGGEGCRTLQDAILALYESWEHITELYYLEGDIDREWKAAR